MRRWVTIAALFTLVAGCTSRRAASPQEAETITRALAAHYDMAVASDRLPSAMPRPTTATTRFASLLFVRTIRVGDKDAIIKYTIQNQLWARPFMGTATLVREGDAWKVVSGDYPR